MSSNFLRNPLHSFIAGHDEVHLQAPRLEDCEGCAPAHVAHSLQLLHLTEVLLR